MRVPPPSPTIRISSTDEVERYFGSRHRVFGRYSYLRDDDNPVTPLPDGSGTLTSGVIGHAITRGDGVVAEHD